MEDLIDRTGLEVKVSTDENVVTAQAEGDVVLKEELDRVGGIVLDLVAHCNV